MKASQYFSDVFAGILGNLTLAEYTVGFFFAILGVFIYSGLQTVKAINRTDNGTPNKFSASYWIKDNLMHKLASSGLVIALIFISLRFPKEICEYIGYAGLAKLSLGIYSLIIGFGLDWAVDKYLKGQIPAINDKKIENATNNFIKERDSKGGI